MKSNAQRFRHTLLSLFCGVVCQTWSADMPPPEKAAAALEACPVTAAPEKLYAVFNDFCAAYFGAEKEPLVYDLFGKELNLFEDGLWIHASENSAVVAFETNLPAFSTVDFGAGPEYGKRSEIRERPYYIHVHYLRDLTPGTTYHYRIEAVDERGQKVHSKDLTLTTRAQGDAIHVPGDLKGPPFVLDQSGATYILTADLSTRGVAFEVVGDDITLDLNGHTVRFAEQATENVPAGILARGSVKSKLKYLSSGFRLLNGTVVQGSGEALNKNDQYYNFCPVSIKGADEEVAGVTIEYHGPQIWGLTLGAPTGQIRVHHNVLLDKGGIIKNRHGAATRSIGLANAAKEENAFAFHHNLIKRTRQNGIGGANHMYNNEIYVDSFSTNSFAIQPNSVPGVKAGEHHHNRIFGTGFNPYGFGWAHESLNIHHNLVHFQGLMVNHRWASVESWGDMSTLEAMRVTNYGEGGQVRNDLTYSDNLIVLRGRGGCELRGTGFFSDNSIRNLVFRNNTVKVISEDAKTQQVACVAAHGHFKKEDTQPVIYRENTLISNRCLIRFGDSYGKGLNHHFFSNTLIHEGDRPDFHTIEVGGAFWTYGHRLVDCRLGEGVSLENVFWQRTGNKSGYAVQWTLDVKAAAGTTIRILNKDGVAEFEGAVPANGELHVPLTQTVIHPAIWPDGVEAQDSTEIKKESKTPHEVIVKMNGEERKTSVTMDRPQKVTF